MTTTAAAAVQGSSVTGSLGGRGRRSSSWLVVLVLVVLSTFTMTATTERAAHAFAPAPAPVTLPGAATGIAKSPNGALVAGAFLLGYYGSQKVLTWAFGSQFGADVPPSGATTPTGWSPGLIYANAVPGGLCDSSGACPYVIEAVVQNPANNDAANVYVGYGSGVNYINPQATYYQVRNGEGVWRTSPVMIPANAFDMPTGTYTAHLFQCCSPQRKYGTTGVNVLRGSGPRPYTSSVRLSCKTPNGATAQWESTPTQYVAQPGGAGPEVTVPSCAQVLPDSYADKVEVIGGPQGQAAAPVMTQTLYSDTASSQYPTCAASPTACQLVPKVGGVSCFTAGTECGSWATRANATCSWGPYTVPNSWCTDSYGDWLGQPSTLPPVDPGVDPAQPVPGTPGAGTTVTNPDGSTTQTQTQTLPDGSTRTVTTTTRPDGSKTITTQPLNPDGSPKGPPSVVEIPAPGGGQTPEGDRDGCLAATFSWNPVSWVYAPVKCALKWAFVPRESVLTPKLQQAKTNLDASPFGQVGAMVGGIGTAVASLDDQASGNCHGPRLPLRWGDDEASVYPVDACPGTWGAYVAPIIKTLSTLLLVVGAVMACASTIGGAFGVKMPWSAA